MRSKNFIDNVVPETKICTLLHIQEKKSAGNELGSAQVYLHNTYWDQRFFNNRFKSKFILKNCLKLIFQNLDVFNYAIHKFKQESRQIS